MVGGGWSVFHCLTKFILVQCGAACLLGVLQKSPEMIWLIGSDKALQSHAAALNQQCLFPASLDRIGNLVIFVQK